MTPDDLLAEINERVGPVRSVLGRKKLKHPRMPKPSWVKQDPLGKVFLAEERLLRHGDVRWAHLVQANGALFGPGDNDAPLQCIYAPDGDATPRELGEAGHRVFGLRNSQTFDPDAAKLGAILENEHLFDFGLTVPASITGGKKMQSSAMYCCRAHLPHGFFANSWFPIFLEQRTGLAIFVPGAYWPEGLLAAWEEPLIARRQEFEQHLDKVRRHNHDAAVAFLQMLKDASAGKPTDPKKVATPVTISIQASEYLAELADQGSDPTLLLRIGVLPPDRGGCVAIELVDRSTRTEGDISYKYKKVRLIMHREQLPLLMGTRIEYHTPGESDRHGLQIENPYFN